MDPIGDIGYSVLIQALQAILVLLLLERGFSFAFAARELFSPKTVIIGAFVGLYGFAYYALDEYELSAYFTKRGYLTLLLLAIWAYFGYGLGFALGAGRKPRPNLPVNYSLLAWYAIALVVIGFIGKFVFIMMSTGSIITYYSAPHRSAGAFASTSGYLNGLPGFIWPGTVLLFASLLRNQLPMLAGRIALAGAVVFYGIQTLIFGNRGDLINLFLLLVMLPMLIGGWFERSRSMLCLCITVMLVGVLLFPHLRSALYLGADKSVIQAVSEVFEGPAVTLDRSAMEGNELPLGAALVNVASTHDLFDFGKSWLHPLINFVPRFMWPDKPYSADWSFSVYNVLPDYYPGWVIPPGAFPTGVADTFVRFSWLSIGAWLILGWWGGAVWRRALESRGVIEVASLWGYTVIMVYFVTQDFEQGWNAWLFNMVPIMFFSWLLSLWSYVRSRSASIYGRRGPGVRTGSPSRVRK